MFDLSVSLGAMGHISSFRAVNCPGAEGTNLSRLKSGGEGHTKEPLRNKHHSLGKSGELFLGRWCLRLSAPVLIV